MTEHSPPFLCPACGYDLASLLGETPVPCPECGTSVARHQAAHFARPISMTWTLLVWAITLLAISSLGFVFNIGVVYYARANPDPFNGLALINLLVIESFLIVPYLAVALFAAVRRWRRVPPFRRSRWIRAAFIGGCLSAVALPAGGLALVILEMNSMR